MAAGLVRGWRTRLNAVRETLAIQTGISQMVSDSTLVHTVETLRTPNVLAGV